MNNLALKYRQDFPLLKQEVYGKPLVYLDNAATSQKPTSVLKAVDYYYCNDNANIHRGLYALSERATQAYESVRDKVSKFIGATSSQEIIFTSGTTESINLVAHSWGRKNLSSNDAILLTEMEHHSNLVPWHLLREQIGFQIKFIPVTAEGSLDLSQLEELLKNVKLVSLNHMSNVLGTINDVKKVAELAHQAGALVLVDGAQSVAHMPVDMKVLDCDFYAFSGHKMCAPTGCGVLWAKKNILEEMGPFLGGGEMIHQVFLDHSTYAEVPNRFEAGTMNIAQVVGLGAAIDYLSEIGMDKIFAYEQYLLELATEKLQKIEGLSIFGQAPHKGAVISFLLDQVHPHDLATILDQEGIAIRAGHHCAQPLMRKFDLISTARASFYFYNMPEEIDVLVQGLEKAKEMFAYVR